MIVIKKFDWEDGDGDQKINDGDDHRSLGLLLLQPQFAFGPGQGLPVLEAGGKVGIYNDQIGAYPIHFAIMHEAVYQIDAILSSGTY